MTCPKCDKELPKGRRRFCSDRCSKLFLKAEYRKRNRDKLYAYKNEWRKAKNGGNRPLRSPANYREAICLNCGTNEDLQAAHVKPIGLGGTHKYIITLCRTHHHDFDERLRGFWQIATIT